MTQNPIKSINRYLNITTNCIYVEVCDVYFSTFENFM